MNDSVRVLTYNVQMRSWGMEAGAQGSLTPSTSVEKRAEAIAARILASPQQYDVLCFQEVFDEDGREALFDALQKAYPHCIKKCDTDGIAVVTEIALGVAAFSATIPGGAALAIVAGVVGGLGLLFGSNKFEDSGLMLFSKLPFDDLPVPQNLRDLAESRGVSLPPSIPATEFDTYSDSGGEDAFAAKGVLYVRLLRSDGRPLHLLTTHTQADSTGGVGAHAVTRRLQLAQAFGLLAKMAGNVAQSEVLLCGDLNVDGMKHRAGFGAEWTSLFDTAGSPFTDVLSDAWTREQCPGAPAPGRTLLVDDFDRGMTAQLQRLDYAIRSHGPATGRLVLQHMCIAYDVATDPANLTAYTSDHLPVRIDLDADRAFASVLTAEPLPPDVSGMPVSIVPGGDASASGLLVEGQMHWYRIHERGAYDIRLLQGAPRVHLDVYTADNLSVPIAPFTTLDDLGPLDRAGSTRYALPTAPFYLRVSRPDRQGEAHYSVSVHRFGGTGPHDAIPLLRGITENGVASTKQLHSADVVSTPFDELDSVWFIAPFDTEPDGSLRVTSTATVTSATRAFGVLVLGRAPGGGFERLDERRAAADVTSTFAYDRPLTGYILVRREGQNLKASEFQVTLRSDVSYLYGNPVNPASRAGSMARLFCRDETNGAFGSEWGSDDIQINVNVNGRTRVHVPNSDDLEFDDDSLRDVPQVDIVRYRTSVEFELVELDDLSAVDRASVQIASFDEIKGGDSVITGNASGVLTTFTVIFDPADDEDDDDDGIYDLTVTVSPEPPRQT
jgi:endonuclease/exonuclease/phosphatase family metal-dependent hydrolase